MVDRKVIVEKLDKIIELLEGKVEFSDADDNYILYSYTIDPNNKVEYPRTIVHAGLEATCHKLKEQKEKTPERSDFKYKVVKLSTFIKKFGDRGWQKYKFYKGMLNKNFSAETEDWGAETIHFKDAIDGKEVIVTSWSKVPNEYYVMIDGYNVQMNFKTLSDVKNYLYDKFNKVINFSTPVEDRSYRDALDAIEEAKSSSALKSVHAPDKYGDYYLLKNRGTSDEKGTLGTDKQVPIPIWGVYVGSFNGKVCKLNSDRDSHNDRDCILYIDRSNKPVSKDDLLKNNIRPMKGLQYTSFRNMTHQERDKVNKYIQARLELNKYQRPMTVNSREEFIRLAKEIADKLHEYNKQGL